MNSRPWLYPVLAAAAIGVWNRFSQDEIYAAEENPAFSQKVSQPGPEVADPQKYSGQIDFAKLQQAIAGMPKEKLLENIEATKSVAPEDENGSAILALLVRQLAKQDPALALGKFPEEWNNETSRLNWAMMEIYGEWVDKDQAAAIAWLDRQVEAGMFSNTASAVISDWRYALESFVFYSLIKNDPAGAAKRIAAIPEDKRESVFLWTMRGTRGPEYDEVLADLTRRYLKEAEASHVLVEYGQRMAVTDDYGQVDAFFSAAHLTLAEKAQIARSILSRRIEKVADDEKFMPALDQARAWAATHVGGEVDRITGEALAMNRVDRFANVALHYQESTGSDAVLMAYLTQSRTPENRKLIDQIKDTEQRQILMELPQYQTR